MQRRRQELTDLKMGGEIFNETEIRSLQESTDTIEPVSDERKDELLKEGMERQREVPKACVICDRFCYSDRPYGPSILGSTALDLNDCPRRAMKKLLQPPTEKPLPGYLLHQYNIANMFNEVNTITTRWFSNLLLSPRGVEENERLRFCSECLASLTNSQKLMRADPDVDLKPPKFAIASGKWIGWLPDHFKSMSKHNWY